MREMGLEWADASQARPADLVKRDFTATRSNQLGVTDLTCVAAWRGYALHGHWQSNLAGGAALAARARNQSPSITVRSTSFLSQRHRPSMFSSLLGSFSRLPVRVRVGAPS